MKTVKLLNLRAFPILHLKQRESLASVTGFGAESRQNICQSLHSEVYCVVMKGSSKFLLSVLRLAKQEVEYSK